MKKLAKTITSRRDLFLIFYLLCMVIFCLVISCQKFLFGINDIDSLVFAFFYPYIHIIASTLVMVPIGYFILSFLINSIRLSNLTKSLTVVKLMYSVIMGLTFYLDNMCPMYYALDSMHYVLSPMYYVTLGAHVILLSLAFSYSILSHDVHKNNKKYKLVLLPLGILLLTIFLMVVIRYLSIYVSDIIFFLIDLYIKYTPILV